MELDKFLKDVLLVEIVSVRDGLNMNVFVWIVNWLCWINYDLCYGECDFLVFEKVVGVDFVSVV